MHPFEKQANQDMTKQQVTGSHRCSISLSSTSSVLPPVVSTPQPQQTEKQHGVPSETLQHKEDGGQKLEGRSALGTYHLEFERQDQLQRAGGLQMIESFQDNHHQRFLQGQAAKRESSKATSTREATNQVLMSHIASFAPWKQLLGEHNNNQTSNSETISTNSRDELMLPSWDIVEPESYGNQTVYQQELESRCESTTSQTMNDLLVLAHCSLNRVTSGQAEQTVANELHKTMQLCRHSLQDNAETNQQDKELKHQDGDEQDKQQLYTKCGLTPSLEGSLDYLPRPFHPSVGRPTNIVASVNHFQDHKDVPRAVDSGLANINGYELHQTDTLPSLYHAMMSESRPPVAVSVNSQPSLGHTVSFAPLSLVHRNADDRSNHECPRFHNRSFAVPHPCQDSGKRNDVAAHSVVAGSAISVQPRYQFCLPQGHQQEFEDWQMNDPCAVADTTKIDVPYFPTVHPSVASASSIPKCTAGDELEKKKDGDTIPRSSSYDEGGDDSASQREVIYKVSSPPVKPLSAYNFFFVELRDWIIRLNDAERERLVPDEYTEGINVSFAADNSYSRNGSLARIMIMDQSSRYSQDERKRQLLFNHWNKDRKTRRKHRSIHGKVSFSRINKIVSSEWKALNNFDKEFYKDVGSDDKKRYKEQMQQEDDQEKG